MARAKAKSDRHGLYDFNLWVEEQLALLEAGAFERLDLANLIEEIADMARSQRKAIRSDLVVLLTHLLEWQHQPQGRSTSWAGSIVEHRRRIREEIEKAGAWPDIRRDLRAMLPCRPRAGGGRERPAPVPFPADQSLHRGSDPRSGLPARVTSRDRPYRGIWA
jgi:hypothetical protein